MTTQSELSCSYRYHEMAAIIVSSIVRSAFIASRYTAEPAESTDAYHDRMGLTLVHIHNKYRNKVAEALEKMVVAPESNVQSDNDEISWPSVYDDPYETAYTLLDELSSSIAREVADPAQELDINKIEEYFTNENR